MPKRLQNNVEYFDRLLTLLEYAFELFPDVKWDLDTYSPSIFQDDPDIDSSDNKGF